MQCKPRTNIHPGTWRDFEPELIRFCHEARIDEVLLREEHYEIAPSCSMRRVFTR